MNPSHTPAMSTPSQWVDEQLRRQAEAKAAWNKEGRRCRLCQKSPNECARGTWGAFLVRARSPDVIGYPVYSPENTSFRSIPLDRWCAYICGGCIAEETPRLLSDHGSVPDVLAGRACAEELHNTYQIPDEWFIQVHNAGGLSSSRGQLLDEFKLLALEEELFSSQVPSSWVTI